jgi:hypothetical protein
MTLDNQVAVFKKEEREFLTKKRCSIVVVVVVDVARKKECKRLEL